MVVRPVFTHPWEVSPAEAMEIQRQLCRHVIIVPLDCGPGTVAGIDVGVKGKQARAAVVLYSYSELGPSDDHGRDAGFVSLRAGAVGLPCLVSRRAVGFRWLTGIR